MVQPGKDPGTARAAYRGLVSYDREVVSGWSMPRPGTTAGTRACISAARKTRQNRILPQFSPAGYAEAWYNHGSALSDLDRHDEAVISYDVATTLQPEYTEAWYNRGVALGVLGRYAEAVVSFDRVIAINPGDAEAWYSRGHALRCLGRRRKQMPRMIRPLPLIRVRGNELSPGHP